MISVIIPVYNVENYIDQCLESVVFQTYDDLEILGNTLQSSGQNWGSGSKTISMPV